jgi:Protein of unknown function (DUF3592)
MDAMTEPEDARPADAVPPPCGANDEPPLSEPAKTRKPSRTRRIRRPQAPRPPRGLAKTVYLSGTALVVVCSTVAAFSRWDSVTWSYAWDLACAGAFIGLVSGIARIVLAFRDGSDVTFSLFISLITWVMAAIFGLSMSSTLHDLALAAAATEHVTATVTDCSPGDGDSAPQCTYHWTIDGHAYTQTARALKALPDGDSVTVWIDPAHPAGPVIDDHNATPWSLVGASIFGGVLVLVGLPMLYAEEFVRDDD